MLGLIAHLVAVDFKYALENMQRRWRHLRLPLRRNQLEYCDSCHDMFGYVLCIHSADSTQNHSTHTGCWSVDLALCAQYSAFPASLFSRPRECYPPNWFGMQTLDAETALIKRIVFVKIIYSYPFLEVDKVSSFQRSEIWHFSFVIYPKFGFKPIGQIVLSVALSLYRFRPQWSHWSKF